MEVQNMLERLGENCPRVIEVAKYQTWKAITNPTTAVISIIGWEDMGLGVARAAKYIVKEAMDTHQLFDILIWISMPWKDDWSIKNIQMMICKRLGGLNQAMDDEDNDDEHEWDEEEVANKIYYSLLNKKLLLVLEEPPSVGIKISAVGVPLPSRSNGNKILIVTASPDVCKTMQTDQDIKLEEFVLEGFVTIGELVDQLLKEELMDVADSPRFRDHLMHHSILGCFLCMLLLGRTSGCSGDDLIYWWLGEGLINGRGGNTILESKIVGQDLLIEFMRRGLVTTSSRQDENLPYYKMKDTIRDPLFDYLRFPSGGGDVEFQNFGSWKIYLKYEDSKLEDHDDVNWISLVDSDLKQIHHSLRCPKASMLVSRGCAQLEDIKDDLFKKMEGLRVLDLSGTSLSSLPASLSCLAQSLRVLNLRNCHNIKDFPASIQILENLEILDLSGTSLVFDKHVHEQIFFRPLCKIRLLNLSNNPFLTSFPSSFFSNLTNLEQLLLEGYKSLFSASPNVDADAASLKSLPSSVFHNCINLKNLVLRDCFSLKTVVSHLQELQALESVDLSGCKALQDVSSFGRFKLPNLRFLNLSGTTIHEGHLYLRGYTRLEAIELESVTGIEVLDLSGTKIKRFPHEVCSNKTQTLLRRLYLLSTNHLRQVDWGKIDHLPKDLLIWNQWDDYWCYSLPIESRHQRTAQEKQLGLEAFVSVNSSKIFLSLPESESESESQVNKLFRQFSRFHITISPPPSSPERRSKCKDDLVPFQRKQFPYRDIHFTPSPSTHFAHFTSKCREGGHLKIEGGNSFPLHLRGIFQCTKFFYLCNNNFFNGFLENDLKSFSMLKNLWIEKCHGVKIFFNSEDYRASKLFGPASLEKLWISDLARLRTLCNVQFDNLISFSSLRQIRLEYCPMLLNVFFGPWFQNFPRLETLEIKFCGRLNVVFREDMIRPLREPGLEDPFFPFPRLHTLCLWELPALKSIFRGNAYLPKLKKLRVRGCPNLRNLPFRLTELLENTDGKIDIEGELQWWNQLEWKEWEEQSIKSHINFKERDSFKFKRSRIE